MSIRIIDDHEVCEQQLRTANKRADKAEADLDRAYERYDKAREYRQQSVEYRESRDKWCEVAVRDQLSSRDTLPRVITADELRDGQVIAWLPPRWDIRKKWRLGTILETMGHAFRVREVDYGSTAVDGEWELYSKLVLLADAPDTKDINVAKETVKGEYPDNPWFATVYEDATYWAETWRGTPVRPQSIRAGDLYDIHTAHGSRITGVVAARNGVRNPQNGDMYRLVRKGAA